jgi:hypothetical protein
VPRGVGTERLKERLFAVAASLVATAALASAQAAWEVCLTPDGDRTKVIVTALENAKSSRTCLTPPPARAGGWKPSAGCFREWGPTRVLRRDREDHAKL